MFDVNEVSNEFILLEKDQFPANISGKYIKMNAYRLLVFRLFYINQIVNIAKLLSLGESHIMEYEIVGVEAFKEAKHVTYILNGTSTDKITEISRMVVEITFRRKIQYHVANTFLQVFMLHEMQAIFLLTPAI